MKDRITKGWTFWRGLYLVMGGIVMTEAVMNHQWPGLLFGGYFAAMAVFNFGCAAGACYTSPPQRTLKTGEGELKFEEVKAK
jgi:hypothetical protein